MVAAEFPNFCFESLRLKSQKAGGRSTSSRKHGQIADEGTAGPYKKRLGLDNRSKESIMLSQGSTVASNWMNEDRSFKTKKSSKIRAKDLTEIRDKESDEDSSSDSDEGSDSSDTHSEMSDDDSMGFMRDNFKK